ncbi:MAG: hypothetical protein KJP03_02930 [Gammaproteobacteria bacterium]|nr:hypothetical protein [Gammaproteobacteria bacterium]
MVSSINATSANGIQKNTQALQDEARNIAKSGSEQNFDAQDVAKSLVKAKQHLRGVEASSRVIEVTDRAVGHLIDVIV